MCGCPRPEYPNLVPLCAYYGRSVQTMACRAKADALELYFDLLLMSSVFHSYKLHMKLRTNDVAHWLYTKGNACFTSHLIVQSWRLKQKGRLIPSNGRISIRPQTLRDDRCVTAPAASHSGQVEIKKRELRQNSLTSNSQSGHHTLLPNTTPTSFSPHQHPASSVLQLPLRANAAIY